MSSQPKPRPKAKGGTLGELLSTSGAGASAAARKKKEPARRESAPAIAADDIVTRSISFTPASLSTLDHFVEQLTRPRRTASRSGVVRALLAYSEKLDDKKLIEALNNELEREARTGEVVWGSRPGEGK
jgi:hypothetical protein